jgi:hypothetical protein
MGALRITDLNGAQLFEPPEFGDPGEPIEFGPYPDCPSNTFGGSVEFRNSSVIEMEGNQIGGSVQLDGSQIDVWDNQIAGSLQCHGSSALTDHDGDATPNSVPGANTC